jgi:hypothetical protein
MLSSFTLAIVLANCVGLTPLFDAELTQFGSFEGMTVKLNRARCFVSPPR